MVDLPIAIIYTLGMYGEVLTIDTIFCWPADIFVTFKTQMKMYTCNAIVLMNSCHILLLLVLTMFSNELLAQKQIPPTDSFVIGGEVDKPFVFSLKDSTTYQVYRVDSVAIRSHNMQPRSTIRDVHGILLKDVLEKVKIRVESPKPLSEYYVVCMASDDYKVVFSWNELFNTDIGNHVVIITQKDGKTMEEQDDRISMVVPTDFATGRRYLKGLQRIEIRRID